MSENNSESTQKKILTENGDAEPSTSLKRKLVPLGLTILVFFLDQWTKFWIVANIPPYTIGKSFFGDFLRIIHVYNPGIAFSMGNNLSDTFRGILFGIAPLIVLLIVMIVYFRNNEFTMFQRWAVAGIVGGGLGNIYDRFFRSEGVVDFIDVKFYGLFGLERWPTFNVADSAVLICGFLLIISFVRAMIKEGKEQRVILNEQE